MKLINKSRWEEGKRSFLLEVRRANYTLIGEYEGSKAKVDMICNQGHDCSMAPNNFKKGKRCAQCKRHGLDYGRKVFYSRCEANGYTDIGEYILSTKQVQMTCSVGHVIQKLPSNMDKRPGCPVCHGLDVKSNAVSFRSLLNKRGFDLIGEYKNKETPVEVMCDKGHITKIMPGNLTRGQGCGACRGHNQKYLYAHMVSDGDNDICIKFGIASNHKLRLKSQINNNKLVNIRELALWKFEDPSDCRSCETKIKQVFNCGVMRQAVLPDGFSETIAISDFDKLAFFVEQNKGNKIE